MEGSNDSTLRGVEDKSKSFSDNEENPALFGSNIIKLINNVLTPRLIRSIVIFFSIVNNYYNNLIGNSMIKPVRLIIVAFLYITCSLNAHADYLASAIANWDAGNRDLAISELQSHQHTADFSNSARYALISYLGAQSRWSEVLAVNVDTSIAPAYVLESKLDSLKQLGRPVNAISLSYSEAMSRFPSRVPLVTSYLYWAADEGLLSLKKLDEIKIQVGNQKSSDLWLAIGFGYRAIKEKPLAIMAYSRAIELNPSNSEAKLAKVSLLKDLKSNTVAREVSTDLKVAPPLSTIIKKEAAGTEIARADESTSLGASKIHAAINELSEVSADESIPELSSSLIIADQVIGYNKLGKFNLAISAYESIPDKSSLPLPPLLAAQNSYQELKRYDAAELIMHHVTEKYPTFENWVTLFYIKASLNKFEEADSISKMLISTTPFILNKKTATERYNPDYVEAKLVAAQSLAYSNKLVEAKDLLSRLLKNAPGNLEFREFNAVVENWRSNNIKATSEFKKVIADNPARSSTYLGLAESLKDRNNISGALAVLEKAPLRTVKDKKEVSEYTSKLLRKTKMFQLESSAKAEKGTNSIISNYELILKNRLYSPRFGDNKIRVFVDSNLSGYKLPESYTRNTSGVGVALDTEDISVAASVHGNNTDSGVSPLLKLAYTLSDSIKVTGMYDATNQAIPARAQQAKVRGRTSEAGISYTGIDNLTLSAIVSRTNFTDSNKRTELGGTAEYTYYSSARIIASGGLGLAYMSNSGDNSVYYNPSKSTSGWLFNNLEYFHNLNEATKSSSVLSVSLGSVNEETFGSSPSYGVEYQFKKNFTEDLYVKAGLGYNRRNYDGQGTSRWISDVELNWMF